MTKSSATKPHHHVSGEDYPGEWARQVEVALDKDHRRAYLYGGFFVAFVLAVVIAALIGVVVDAPPRI